MAGFNLNLRQKLDWGLGLCKYKSCLGTFRFRPEITSSTDATRAISTIPSGLSQLLDLTLFSQ